jgi:two-component system sensor histidine kinase YesM
MNIRFRFNDLSLKWKSFIIFMLLVLIPTSVLGAVVLNQTDQILRRQAVDSAARVLDIISQNITSIVEDVENISSYMIYDIQFRKYLTYRFGDGEQSEFNNLQDSIHAFSAFQVVSKSYLDSIQLDGMNGNPPLLIGDQVEGDEYDWVYAAMLAQGKYIWSTAYPVTSLGSGKREYVISLFRQIKDVNEINKTIGFVRIRLSERELYSLISSRPFSHSMGTVYMMDGHGQIISHQDPAAIGTKVQEPMLLAQIAEGKSSVSFSNGSKHDVVVARKIPQTDWYVVAEVDEWEIVKHLDAVRTSIKGMIVLSSLMGMIALAGFYWFIIRPISALTEVTMQVEQGHFDTQAPVEGQDEIGRLSLRFNQMLRTIQRLIDTKYKLELQHKEAEFKALQNQVDPHFLYNTLDTIHWTARIERAMETSTLIVALSKLFRISLSQGKMYIPLKQELDYINYYLVLQKKRLRFELHCAIRAEEHLHHALVPKKLLQPLVENSIVHGFEALQRPGTIEIDCTSDRGCLYIDVTDSGKGFEPELMKAFISGETDSGFALRNIQERIVLLFGEGYGLEFFRGKGNGARVRITVPLVRTEEEMKAFMGKEEGPHEDQGAGRG